MVSVLSLIAHSPPSLFLDCRDQKSEEAESVVCVLQPPL